MKKGDKQYTDSLNALFNTVKYGLTVYGNQRLWSFLPADITTSKTSKGGMSKHKTVHR